MVIRVLLIKRHKREWRIAILGSGNFAADITSDEGWNRLEDARSIAEGVFGRLEWQKAGESYEARIALAN
jgi:hypothetical protein